MFVDVELVALDGAARAAVGEVVGGGAGAVDGAALLPLVSALILF